MNEYREITSLLAHCPYLSDVNTRREFNAAACSNLYPVRRQRWVISDGRHRRNVHHGPGGPGVQGQTQDNAARRAKHLSMDDNETMFRVERVAHRTTAVSSGISPV
jgi:hypothetical protein